MNLISVALMLLNVVLLLVSAVANRPKPLPTTPKVSNKPVEYLKQCASLSLIILGITGGLEILLAKALYRADFRVVIANPRQTHQFAMAKSLAKTDAKDAKMLTSCAKMLEFDGEV